ncbi:MAG: 16S rRNA (cytosine(1402)-N(4))-methyltransferase RsmH [Candidatus Omnitrophota bacterium]|nr:16S rRNA (cytosine(1402)-N(4))-methyltransferase RsmH [Candidatus Omnitrophota bacterium]
MHFPVLLREVSRLLAPGPGKVMLDATIGGGGHAREILEKIAPGGRLIAVDRDPEAVKRAEGKLIDFKNEIICVNDDFKNIGRILEENGIEGLDGALFDLGISSYQVDDGQRGFSFLHDGPLDMRYDNSQGSTAGDAVNSLSRRELAEILKQYGEERYAALIAGAIVTNRKKKRIQTTGELRDIIIRAAGRRYRRQRIHPAARTFQALRIYVNDELASVEEAVNKAVRCLRPRGRICVISFHSLEDRIVKNIFRDGAKTGILTVLTKKPVIPERDEVLENPRSRSAKLRAAERTE